MLSLENLLLFVPTMALLVALPGPDFALVSKISLLQGKKHGEFAALGVAAGMGVHTLLAILGISAIIASSAALFAVLKYAGAAYLTYTGVTAIIQSFRSGKSAPVLQAQSRALSNAPRRSLLAGFLTNVLNPKAILYFMVLLPQFISADRPLTGQFLELGLITSLLCATWYFFLANALAGIREIFLSPVFLRWFNRVTGAVFILFGLRLALAKAE